MFRIITRSQDIRNFMESGVGIIYDSFGNITEYLTDSSHDCAQGSLIHLSHHFMMPTGYKTLVKCD
jgi:hypothetical protein